MTNTISESEARRTMASCEGPGWIIDPIAARVLAGNAAGSELLGAAPVALDAAMPAVGRLRDIARGIEPAGASVRPLVLWTASGVRTLDCLVRPIEPSESGAVFLVAAARSSCQSAVDDPRPPMDDAATLREIARRIREGSTTLAAGAGDQPVTPPTASAVKVVEDEETSALRALSASSAPRIGELPRDLIAELAHELKTPLSAIAAAAEVMKDERLGRIDNERYIAYAADIHDGARHALAVIERLLAGACPEASAASAPSAAQHPSIPVDIVQVARSCLSSIRPLADAKGISLASDPAARPVLIAADSTMLRQMLLNLLTNAVKFCRAGDTVRVAVHGNAAGMVTLSVRDTGPGMTSSEISAALASKGRSRRERREGGGIGLGLPLVRSLAEASGGTLKLESKAGKGTTASIVWPRGTSGKGASGSS